MQDIHEEIVRIKHSGTPAALATIVSIKGSTPRSEGAKMLIRADGSTMGTIGGGCLEGQVWEAAIKVIEEKKSRLLDFDLTGQDENPEGLICGGTMQVYIEPIIPIPTVYIFGAGHIGFAVSKIASFAGFRVAVIDDRPAYANKDKFPEADEFYVEDPGEAVSKLGINRNSFLVIACRGHLEDQQVLKEALKTEAAYIGMIGSKKKSKTIIANLKAEGIDEEALKRVHAPIGLPIASETPEEIAISIMAEIVNERRAGEKRRTPVNGKAAVQSPAQNQTGN